MTEMTIYEVYDGVYCRKIDDLEKEKAIRAEKGYGFFELYETPIDMGDDVKLSKILRKNQPESP